MKIVIPTLSDARLWAHRQIALPVRSAYHLSAGLSPVDSVPYSFSRFRSPSMVLLVLGNQTGQRYQHVANILIDRCCVYNRKTFRNPIR